MNDRQRAKRVQRCGECEHLSRRNRAGFFGVAVTDHFCGALTENGQPHWLGFIDVRAEGCPVGSVDTNGVET